MNILAVQGSPRLNKNTDILLEKFLEGVKDKNEKCKINKIFLQEKNIQFCKACNACKNEEIGHCIINDDMQEIYPLISDVNILVLATPVYWWSMSAQLKTFIDRIYGLSNKKQLKGKKCVLLMTYGGALPNEGPRIVEETIKEICNYIGLEFVDVYGVCTDEEVQVSDNPKAQEEVYRLGYNI